MCIERRTVCLKERPCDHDKNGSQVQADFLDHNIVLLLAIGSTVGWNEGYEP
jgi:hypothetical protein